MTMYMLDSFVFVLQKIRKRSGLYIGAPSLENLDNFRKGYEFKHYMEIWEKSTGRDFFGNYEEAIRTGMCSQPTYMMNGFLEFVANHYNVVCIGSMDWQTIISRNTDSDEEAFYKFFELLDVFLEQKGIVFLDD